MDNKQLTKGWFGFIGFSHIQRRFFAYAMFVRGKEVYNIPLPYPLYILIVRLWKRNK